MIFCEWDLHYYSSLTMQNNKIKFSHEITDSITFVYIGDPQAVEGGWPLI